MRSRIVGSLIADGLLAPAMYKPTEPNRQCHYGPVAGCYAIDVGLNAVVSFIGYKVGGKTGDAISYGGDAAEVGFAAYEWNGGPNKHAKDDSSKPDFSGTVILRH